MLKGQVVGVMGTAIKEGVGVTLTTPMISGPTTTGLFSTPPW